MFKKLILLMMISLMNIAAYADDLKEIKFEDWLYKAGSEKAKPYCYAMTTPFRTKANDVPRKDSPVIFVRKMGDQMFTLGLDTRTKLNANTTLKITVNNVSRDLNVKFNKMGWTYSANLDANIINDLLLGDDFFTIETQNEDDRFFLDYYSLKGFEKMLNYMQLDCKVER